MTDEPTDNVLATYMELLEISLMANQDEPRLKLTDSTDSGSVTWLERCISCGRRGNANLEEGWAVECYGDNEWFTCPECMKKIHAPASWRDRPPQL